MTKTQTQIKLENQINTLAKLKEQAEKAKAEFDEYRTQLENQLGLGNWETDMSNCVLVKQHATQLLGKALLKTTSKNHYLTNWLLKTQAHQRALLVVLHQSWCLPKNRHQTKNRNKGV